jgi:hypothetical protein
VLRLLRGLDDCALVEVALIVNVELAEGILQAENLALLELGVLPRCNALLATMEGDGCCERELAPTYLLLQLDDVHVGDASEEQSDADEKEYTKRQSDCLAPPRSGLRVRLLCASCFAYLMTTWGGCQDGHRRGARRNPSPDYVRTSPLSPALGCRVASRHILTTRPSPPGRAIAFPSSRLFIPFQHAFMALMPKASMGP